MLDSIQDRPRGVALISKTSSPTKAAVQEARHLALPVVAMGVVIAILYFGRLLFITSVIAVTIAFILEPFVLLLMRTRMPRPVASFVICTLALLFLYVMGMGAYLQAAGLMDEIPKYSARIGELIEHVSKRIEGMEERTYRILVPARQRQEEQERLRAQQLA